MFYNSSHKLAEKGNEVIFAVVSNIHLRLIQVISFQRQAKKAILNLDCPQDFSIKVFYSDPPLLIAAITSSSNGASVAILNLKDIPLIP